MTFIIQKFLTKLIFIVYTYTLTIQFICLCICNRLIRNNIIAATIIRDFYNRRRLRNHISVHWARTMLTESSRNVRSNTCYDIIMEVKKYNA